MALSSSRAERRIEVRLSGHSNDSEVLDCVIRTLEHPGFDDVDRALVDVSEVSSYDVQPGPRGDLAGHLAGLFYTRRGLRIGIVYRELTIGDLGGFVAEFGSMPGFAMAAFVSRPEAETWLSED